MIVNLTVQNQNKHRLKRLCSNISTNISQKAVLPFFKVNAAFEGEYYPPKKGRLIVSNHISTLDIPIIASRFKTLFVTSTEVRDNPLTGFIARFGGSIFVDRRSIRTLRNDIVRIADLLSSGFNITIFPEATSTDGSTVLPFKCALFEAARVARTEVQPLSISYANSKETGYYGDMSFPRHLLKLLRQKRISAKVRLFDPIKFNSMSANEMAELCRSKIVQDLSQRSPHCNRNAT